MLSPGRKSAAFFILGTLALVTPGLFVHPAVAWLDLHHIVLTREFVSWSPLGPLLSHDDLDEIGQAAFDPDTLLFDATCPTLKRYAPTDSHGIPILGGGVCQTDFPHGNFAHSDVFGAEDNFEAEYHAAVDAWNSGDRHASRHHLAHALHYLEDSAIALHQDCELQDFVDCLLRHTAHEEQIFDWYEADTPYCNLRLDLCGNLRDPNARVGLAFAFRNYPASLVTDDGLSDLADQATLLSHARGWNAKGDADIPNDTPFMSNRAVVGDDWYSNWNWGCPTCASNRDIAFTELWELARVVRGALDRFAIAVGVPLNDLGNDQIELAYSRLEETANTDVFGGAPDLYARFHIQPRANGRYAYEGTTVQDQKDVHTIRDYTIASNLRDDSGSGNWLAPFPNPRTQSLVIDTYLFDADIAFDDLLSQHRIAWSPGTFGGRCNTIGTETACIRATHLGNRWDETAPVTTPTFTGTPGNQGWFRSRGDIHLSATDHRSGVASLRWWLEGATSWNPFTEPLPNHGEGATRWEFSAVDGYGNQEPAAPFVVRVDSVAPSTSLVTDCAFGLPQWCLTPPVVTPGGTDGTSGVASVERRLNGGSWAPGALSIQTEGSHTVEVRARDVAGNERVNAFTVLVDLAPPAVQLLRPAPGHAYVADIDLGTNPLDGTTRVVGPITVRATATDSASGMDRVEFWVNNLRCATDANGADGYAWTWDTACLVGPIPGLHVALKTVAFDRAGRSSTAERMVQWVP